MAPGRAQSALNQHLEQAGERFLVGDPFERLQSAGQVHTLASRVQVICAQAGTKYPDMRVSFKVGGVWEEGKNGEPRKYVFAIGFASGTSHAVAHIQLSGAGIAVMIDPSLSEAELKQREEERKERVYQELRRKAITRIVPAVLDDRALQAQALLEGELNPQTMGHIHDLIQDDVGGAISDLISGNQLIRFNRSINHPKVFGEEARHIVSNQEPPPNPMGMDEARQFIRDLATHWLEQKAGVKTK